MSILWYVRTGERDGERKVENIFFLFQCERGSALHEAAMCGKSDVVQLLLDKGERGERDM